jgi:hypothetical protein
LVPAITIPQKRRTTPDLFADNEDAKAREDGVDEQGDFEVDDDWIIDDIMDDVPGKEKVGKGGRDGFVKEMGRYRSWSDITQD